MRENIDSETGEITEVELTERDRAEIERLKVEAAMEKEVAGIAGEDLAKGDLVSYDPNRGSDQLIKKKSSAIQVRAEAGQLIGTTLDEQWRLAVAYHKSKMLPRHYDSPEKVLAGMQYAYELGLKPLTGMRQICIINGVPSIWGELPLAIVRRSGLMEKFLEYRIDENHHRICEDNENLGSPEFGAVCISLRKGSSENIVTKFTRDDARLAGLHTKDTYKAYPGRMYQMRARSQNLKDNFPDVLSGMSIAEYDFHVDPSRIRDVSQPLVTENSPEGLAKKIEALDL